MPIPNAETAYIPPAKLGEYLLDELHPVGGSKARWFHGLGYCVTASKILEIELLKLVRSSDDFVQKLSPFGTKYIVQGRIVGPAGKEAAVTTVWIVEASDGSPRLVTAYPGDKS